MLSSSREILLFLKIDFIITLSLNDLKSPLLYEKFKSPKISEPYVFKFRSCKVIELAVYWNFVLRSLSFIPLWPLKLILSMSALTSGPLIIKLSTSILRFLKSKTVCFDLFSLSRTKRLL